jgi:alpha-glucoside transport system substrate-binding protein
VSTSREAERRRDETTIAALTGGSLSNLNTDPQLSLLLALHAVDVSASRGEPVPAETVDALHWAMQEAGVEYPVANGLTNLVAGPLGIRGVFDLPVSVLAEAAREEAARPLTSDECERYFEATTCPSLPSAFPANLEVEVVDPTPTVAGRPLFGTRVTIFAGYDQAEVAAARNEFAAFTAETGIEVRFVGNPEFHDYVVDSIAAGDPPDIATLPQPGLVRDLARQGHLIDLGTYVDVEELKQVQSPYLVSLGTVGDEGSWPAEEGTTFGAFQSLNLKSMIWYPVPELRAEGYPIPETWDQLMRLSDRLVSDGRTPWCLGWESEAADGWPGTDWIEHLLLKGAGPEVYDRWAFHEMPFDSPPVRAAFERLGRILFSDGYLADGAVQGGIGAAQRPMVRRDPPGCWLYQFPSFAPAFLPEGSVGVTTDIFPFPSLGNGSRGVVGGGNMFGVFSDRPEVRELVRYILDPSYGEGLAASNTGFLSANRGFDMRKYDRWERRQATLIYEALADDAFRYDASDLMPPPIGAPLEEGDVGLFWNAMMRYAAEGPGSLDAILAELDAAWPDDG